MTEFTHSLETYREKGMDNICFDGAQRLVPNHHKDLLLLFEVNKISKPRFFGKSVRRKTGVNKTKQYTNITQLMYHPSIKYTCCKYNVAKVWGR